MKEFAEKGYKNASTNEIVKMAGISKGLLFHYFRNKKDLFLFLFDYSLEVLNSELFGKIDSEEKDIFDRVRQISLLKYELFKKYPDMFNFYVGAFKEDEIEVKDDIENRGKKFLSSSMDKLFGRIDPTKFKDGIDVQKAVNVMYWSLEGLSNHVYSEYKKKKPISIPEEDFQRIFAHMDSYLEFFKNSFYK